MYSAANSIQPPVKLLQSFMLQKSLQQHNSKSIGEKASLASIRHLLQQPPIVWHAQPQVSCKLHHAMLLAGIADLLLSPAVLAGIQRTEQLPTPAAWLTANETCTSALRSCTQLCNTATWCINQSTSAMVAQYLKSDTD